MNPNPSPGPGSLRSSLVDQEIAHIRRVMPQSLTGDLGGPILPAPYWRQRLNQLLNNGHVSKAQWHEISSLLLQLDEFERDAADGGESHKPAGQRSGSR